MISIWIGGILHRLALRYCSGLFEYSRSLWVLQYEDNDFQGGWWPHVEIHHSESAALRDASRRSVSNTSRNVRVQKVPVGAGKTVFRHREIQL